MPMHGILRSCLGRCPQLLLGIIRQTTKTYAGLLVLHLVLLLNPSLEPLAHCRNMVSLSLFYRYYFGRCSSELAQLVPLPFSRGRSTCYSDVIHHSYMLKGCLSTVSFLAWLNSGILCL